MVDRSTFQYNGESPNEWPLSIGDNNNPNLKPHIETILADDSENDDSSPNINNRQKKR